MSFKIGDRVLCCGWKWLNEADRHGEVVECYQGIPSHNAPGLEMMAIKWDDNGLIERGYLQNSGYVRPEPLPISPNLLPEVV